MSVPENFYSPRKVQLDCQDPSLAKQSFAEECDINAILNRWQKTGVIDHINDAAPQYMDVALVGDYHQSLNAVVQAQESFMALPAVIRARFGNDPGAFLAFAADPANAKAMIDLGLATQGDSPEGQPEGSQEPAGEPPAGGSEGAGA